MDGELSPRILITRLSAIGDCVLTLPMLTELRKANPSALIVWAVEKPTHDLIGLHPAINELVVVPKSWMGKRSNWVEFKKKLRSFKFDIAIDPQGITKSAALGWLSGAKRRIGLRGKWGRELSGWFNNELIDTKSPHIVRRSVELAEHLGSVNGDSRANGESRANCDSSTADWIDYDNLKSELPVCRSASETIDNWVYQNGISRRFAVINPGGAWASKRWEMDRWGAVASYLKHHHEMTTVIVWAGDEERKMAESIRDFDETASIIACKTNLRELAALASKATFFMGGDTGPLHIASAMGTPCIGLYGTTNAIESGAYGSHHLEIQKWFQSGSCRKRRNGDNDAMRDIFAADVFEACGQMLEKLEKTKVA